MVVRSKWGLHCSRKWDGENGDKAEGLVAASRR